VRAFGNDQLSVDKCELLEREFRQWIGANFWEGRSVGGQMRAFRENLSSVDKCELLGRTFRQCIGASFWEGPAFS
jgi:hypothetical protein